MENLMDFSILQKEIGFEVKKNILSGNNYFEMLFKHNNTLYKNIKKLKPYFKKMMIKTHILREKNHIILSINFANSPVIKLLRTIYGIGECHR